MTNNIFNSMKRYPIVFIGSGISKRFLKDYPTWVQLLEMYWGKIDQEISFYNYLLSLRKDLEEDTPSEDLDHKINTKAAEYIENTYNDMFYKDKIKINGLTSERVYNEKISPFKYSICQYFDSYEIKEDINQVELEEFKKFLQRAKMIITTNYDPFIENILKDMDIVFNKYVGSKGLFDDTEGWSELYKIHGDVSDSQSIVITQDDYDLYDKNSILISAKILSNLITNQIIFLGYSLTDRNIRRLLTDFSSQIPQEDERKSAQRIIVVEYDKDNQNLDMTHSSEFGVSFVKVRTDNYSSIFRSIAEINEGMLPSDVLRYKSLIKDLIVQEGGKGNLENILVSPSDLNQLEQNLREGKNLVVALGNDKFVYTHITEDAYLVDYFNEGNAISSKLAIDFIISMVPTQRIPFIKYLNSDLSNLEDGKKARINERIDAHDSLDDIISTVKLDRQTLALGFSSIDDIKSYNLACTKEVQMIVSNIKSFAGVDIEKYIKERGLDSFTSDSTASSVKTELRKLFYAYDLIINGQPKKIP
ncbi:SIR2 family protein [Wohlfahrtiimonas populi]|uniref:SIR2 family protein n=1 Tax=Wohlfahrtiimonas populi TaxID=1940240 RepID=UPI00098D2F3E|nr:SIR2 family protein [Wohlfahrtiimonas populi]